MLARVLLVDDHPAVRRTLRALLAEASVGICGEAENGRQAIDKASELQPDVVVLDLVMPKMNGLEAAYEIRQRAPSSKIILLSLHYSPEDGLALANALGEPTAQAWQQAQSTIERFTRMNDSPGDRKSVLDLR